MSALHPDFPALTDEASRTWNMPDPLSDIAQACEAARGHDIAFGDIASVTDYYIESNWGGVWEPGGTIGSELTIALVGTLSDGRWFGLEAWNDYTGWGCQDGGDVYVGDTKADVITNGLTEEGRNHLKLAVTA